MLDTLYGLALQSGTDINAKAYEESVGTGTKPTLSLIESMGGRQLASGERVTPEIAMTVSTVNACVRVRAETPASLPCLTYRRLKDGGKKRLPEHPLYEILRYQPNPWQSSFEWVEFMQRELWTRGNAYSLVERDYRGQVTGLIPLRSDRVTVRKGKDLLPYYQCSELDGSPILGQDRVFHLRNLSADGYVGRSPVQECMEAVGATLAVEKFGASLFGNGAGQSGYFIYKGKIAEDQYKTLMASMRERVQGQRNRHLPSILDGEWSYQATGMKADEAQFLETRNFHVEDIARMYRMPSLMIGHADKTSTFASAEQFFLAYVTYSLRPDLVRWEQAIKRSLLIGESDIFVEFLIDGLLRGDLKSRYAAYAIARQWGWLSADEIREFENMNPLPDDKGKIYLEPLNMIEAGEERDDLAADETPAGKAKAMLEFARRMVRTLGPGQEEEDAKAA